jgi:hypothetical protein
MSHTADAADEATDWVAGYIAGERAARGSVKAACAAAARFFGITPRRAASYWWKQVSSVPADEYLRLREAHYQSLRLQRLRAEHELAELDALLAKIGPNAVHQTIHASPASLPHMASQTDQSEAATRTLVAG